MDVTEAAIGPSRGRAADLYERHAAYAVQLSYLLTGNRHLAEDLAQDAFVRLFGRFHEFRKPEAFGFYLSEPL
jgi:DNA-directed RNA polymerase specialized sigma24 family protein